MSESVFPDEEYEHHQYSDGKIWPNGIHKLGGLTKRELFAAMIAAGSSGNPKEIAEHAVWTADALIAEIDKERE